MRSHILKECFERARNENGGLTALGTRFYERLFSKYPQVKPLFKKAPAEQHKKLMASIGTIVAASANPEALYPFLHAMGLRHIAYGVVSDHYPIIAENLVFVIGEHLSKEGEWTEEMQTAWVDALNTTARIMLECADNPEACRDEIAAAGFAPDGFRKLAASAH